MGVSSIFSMNKQAVDFEKSRFQSVEKYAYLYYEFSKKIDKEEF